MEVLYVSMGNTLPATGNDAAAAGDAAALLLEANLGDLEATETPKPSKAHNQLLGRVGLLGPSRSISECTGLYRNAQECTGGYSSAQECT